MDRHPRPVNSDQEDLQRKRRAIAQGQKACNPCRLRKVKCSYQSPCQTCVERQHPELCEFDAPLKRVWVGPSTDPAESPTQKRAWSPSEDDWNALVSKMDRLELGVQALLSHRIPAAPAEEPRYKSPSAFSEADIDTELPRGVHGTHHLSGETLHLGGNSIPAMAVALSQTDNLGAVRELLGKSVLPIFTLENESATYPFVDLWGLPHSSTERIRKLCELLPSNSQCLEYVRQYRDTAHVLFPAIVDIQKFEMEAMQFFATRTMHSVGMNKLPLTEQNVYGSSVRWLGLLFACLASGCQCSNMPRRERQLTSQVYVCCAYECLRIINYLSCSQASDVQTLLVLGNVISNNMNAGVAWTFLGVTIRVAQGLGLHHAPSAQIGSDDSMLRHDIWSRIIWQDSLLSITFDRSTLTTAITQWDMSYLNKPLSLSYVDCMLQLCTMALDAVCNRVTSSNTHKEVRRIEDAKNAISSFEQQAHGHLRELTACVSMKDYLEHWNWRMHRSYVISELCRPMLARHRREDPSVWALRAVCVEALTDTVDAFLNLQSLSTFARTSWAAVHRSLSSALLLGILKEPARNERVRRVLGELIVAMSSEEYSNASEVPAPVARSVEALLRLNESDSMEEASATSTRSDTYASEEASPHAQVYSILWGVSVPATTQ